MPYRRSSLNHDGSSERLMTRDRLLNKFKESRYFDPKTCPISRMVDAFPQPPASPPQRKLKISAPSLQASSNPITTQYSSFSSWSVKQEPTSTQTALPTRDIYEIKDVTDPSDATYTVCRGMLLKRLEAFEVEKDLPAKPLEVIVPDIQRPGSTAAEIVTGSPDPLAGYSYEPDEETINNDSDDESYYADDCSTPEDELFCSPLKSRLSASFSVPYSPWPPTPMPCDKDPMSSPLYKSLLQECKRPSAATHGHSDSFASTLVGSQPPSRPVSAGKQLDSPSLRPPLVRNAASTGSCTLLPSPGLPLTSSPCPTFASAPGSLTCPPLRPSQHNAASPALTLSSASTAVASPPHSFTSPTQSFNSPPQSFPSKLVSPPLGFVRPSPPQSPYAVHPLFRRASSSEYEEFSGNPFRMSRVDSEWTDDNVSLDGDEESRFSVIGREQLSRSVSRKPSRSPNGLRRQNARGKTSSTIGACNLQRSDTTLTFLEYYGVEKKKSLPPIPVMPAKYAQQRRPKKQDQPAQPFSEFWLQSPPVHRRACSE